MTTHDRDRRIAADVRGRALADPAVAAGPLVLRRARQPPLRRDHPAAGVLPDPPRDRDPARAQRRRSSPLTGATTLIELGLGYVDEDPPAARRVHRRRPGAAVRAARRQRRGPDRGRGGDRARLPDARRCSRWWPTSPNRSTSCPGGRVAGWSSSSAARSATSTTPSAAAFLTRIRAALDPGDHFLLGADLVKPPSRLIAAYDDSCRRHRRVQPQPDRGAAQRTRRRRALRRRLRARGPVEPGRSIGSRCGCGRRRDVRRALRRARPRLEAAGRRRRCCTEISVKFRLPELQAELRQHGLDPVRSWTDPDGDYSLTLARAAR